MAHRPPLERKPSHPHCCLATVCMPMTCSRRKSCTQVHLHMMNSDFLHSLERSHRRQEAHSSKMCTSRQCIAGLHNHHLRYTFVLVDPTKRSHTAHQEIGKQARHSLGRFHGCLEFCYCTVQPVSQYGTGMMSHCTGQSHSQVHLDNGIQWHICLCRCLHNRCQTQHRPFAHSCS